MQISRHNVPFRRFYLSAISALVVTFSFLSGVQCAMAEFKIVTVDVNRVLNESTTAKARKKELDEKSLKARKQVEDRRNALKATEEKLKAAKVKEDSKEAEEFRNEVRAYTRFAKDLEEEVKKEFMKVNKELTDRAVGAVKNYAEKNKIDLVLDKSEQNRGPVLFGASAADVTQDVISQMNG